MKGLTVFILMMCLSFPAFADSAKVYSEDDLNKYRSDDALPPPDYVPPREVKDEDKSKAYFLCTELIKNRLKTPSVAKFNTFANLQPDESVSYEGGYYKVIGTVDSQNSYGAMLRSKFYCSLYKDAAGNWHTKDAEVLK